MTAVEARVSHFFTAASTVLSVIALIIAVDVHIRTQSTATTPTTINAGSNVKSSADSDAQSAFGDMTNTFYANFDTCTRLGQSIFGPPRRGSLNSYNEFCPAVKTFGGALVNGIVITDDVVLRVNNMYISMRDALDLGTSLTIMSSTMGAGANSAAGAGTNAATPAWMYALCHGADARGGLYCAWRRNWGVDSCMPTTTSGVPPAAKLCACGGGWAPNTGIVRLRHFICDPEASFDACKRVFYAEAPRLCAPASTVSTDRSAVDGHAWYDVMVDCGQPGMATQSMCAPGDRAAYLDIYASGSQESVQQTPQQKRDRVNTYVGWSVTQDLSYIYDYFLQLSDNIWRDCLQPRLSLKYDPQNVMPAAAEAVWACDIDQAAHLEFLHDGKIDREDQHQGATYYVTTVDENGIQWCLSKPLYGTNSSIYTGIGAPLIKNRLYWIQTNTMHGVLGDVGLCQSVYLGGRRLMQSKTLENVGRHATDDRDFAVYQQPAPVMVYTCDA